MDSYAQRQSVLRALVEWRARQDDAFVEYTEPLSYWHEGGYSHKRRPAADLAALSSTNTNARSAFLDALPPMGVAKSITDLRPTGSVHSDVDRSGQAVYMIPRDADHPVRHPSQDPRQRLHPAIQADETLPAANADRLEHAGRWREKHLGRIDERPIRQRRHHRRQPYDSRGDGSSSTPSSTQQQQQE